MTQPKRFGICGLCEQPRWLLWRLSRPVCSSCYYQRDIAKRRAAEDLDALWAERGDAA